jgi:hypothetical protein
MLSGMTGTRQPPALRYERWPIAELVQDPGNARGHSRRNIEEIKASLARFGQRLPVVVREGRLVGGNATQVAAFELGWTDLDVVLADDLSEGEARRLAVALNRSAELAHWNHDVLTETLRGFADDLSGTGFTSQELEDLESLGRPAPPAEADTSPQRGGVEYRVIVECGSEAEQAQLIARFAADGLVCRAVIT